MNLFRGKRITPILIAALVATALVCLIFYAFRWEPNSIDMERKAVSMPRWPEKLNGLNVVLLSDIHQGNSPEDFARLDLIIEMTNAEEPDLILLLGDYMIGSWNDRKANKASPRQIARQLSKLKAKHGVFAVLGNHDWWYDGHAIVSELKKAGIRVLENETETVVINGEPLNIIGLPDNGTRSYMFRADALPDPAIPAILMAHDPESFRKLDLPYALTVSGHTHGGQVRFPGFGSMITPADLGTPYVSGLFSDGDRQLYVSRGLGTSIAKVRFMCTPEITVLKLSGR